MEEMTRKQPDVDKITKTHKRKAAVETQNQSQIPVLGKGRAGRTYRTNGPLRSVSRAICAGVESPSHYLAAAGDDVTCFLISCFCLSFAGKRSPTQTMYVSATQAPIETKNPQVNLLVTKWQHVWLLALDRRRKLNDCMDRLEEVRHSRIRPRPLDFSGRPYSR